MIISQRPHGGLNNFYGELLPCYEIWLSLNRFLFEKLNSYWEYSNSIFKIQLSLGIFEFKFQK